MKNKYVKPRHRFWFSFLRPVGRLIASKYHFKTKPIKVKKGEQYLVLSNHQGVLDPVFVCLTFKTPMYIIAADSMFTNKWYSRLMVHFFSPIKKRKGVMDIQCIRALHNIVKEGGSVLLFPEGNRAWADFQMHIDPSVCKLIRMLKIPVALYNLCGGYGTNPRWSPHVRKGYFHGGIKRILSVEEVANMSDEQLYQTVVSNLKVIDTDSGHLYKSKKRAEYLERQLFICPKCHSVSTLHSHGNDITCTQCGLTATYGEDMLLSSPDADFPFTKVVDWYSFQQQQVQQATVTSGQTIFADNDIAIYDKSTQQHILLSKGTMTLSPEALTVGDITVPTSQIVNSSVVGGVKLYLNTKDKSYFIIGHERFNAIKYLLYFNILCPEIAEKGGDKYYGLHIPDGSR